MSQHTAQQSGTLQKPGNSKAFEVKVTWSIHRASERLTVCA